MSRKNSTKPYWEMTSKELKDSTKQFDEEFIADRARPMSAEMKRRWKRARRKLARLTDDKSEAVITIRLDKTLAKRFTTLAKK